MQGSQVEAAALPPSTRALAESLLDQVDLAVGSCKLTLIAQDGDLRYLLREEKVPATALGRFDRAADSSL